MNMQKVYWAENRNTGKYEVNSGYLIKEWIPHNFMGGGYNKLSAIDEDGNILVHFEANEQMGGYIFKPYFDTQFEAQRDCDDKNLHEIRRLEREIEKFK